MLYMYAEHSIIQNTKVNTKLESQRQNLQVCQVGGGINGIAQLFI